VQKVVKQRRDVSAIERISTTTCTAKLFKRRSIRQYSDEYELQQLHLTLVQLR